ncbi:Uncharacterised protein [Actinobacillus pleuropneumoniae]|nr:Uncharacterised protein [Actinobacillus pleuropneumoniae]
MAGKRNKLQRSRFKPKQPENGVNGLVRNSSALDDLV